MDHPLVAKDNHREMVWTLGVALIVLAITFGFAIYRFIIPSDGAWLVSTDLVWTREGVVVEVMTDRPDGLRSGDVVTGIEGVNLRECVSWLFEARNDRPTWRVGETLGYSVVRDGSRLTVPVTLEPYPLLDRIKDYWGVILFTLVTQLIALYVFLRRSGDQAARLLFLWAVCTCHVYVWSFGLQASDLLWASGFWLYSLIVHLVWLLYWCLALNFALVFPQRNIVLKQYPRLTLSIIYGLPSIIFAVYLIYTRLRSESLMEWVGGWMIGGYLVAAVSLVLMVGINIWTYRFTRDPVDRKKIRWVVYATFLSGGGSLILWILPPLFLGRALIGINELGLLLLPFPIALAIAILRHQLFDIDFIIKKTMVYGSLTLTLAAIYLVSVVVLQEVFRRLTGQIRSPLVTVISTLAIASLFNPLRKRIQSDIDRRFFRSKYDAERILSSFSSTLREDVDLDHLSGQLLDVVEDTMQPQNISLWLKKA